MAEGADFFRSMREFEPPAAVREHWPDFEKTIGSFATGWPAELNQVRRWYRPDLGRPQPACARVACWFLGLSGAILLTQAMLCVTVLPEIAR